LDIFVFGDFNNDSIEDVLVLERHRINKDRHTKDFIMMAGENFVVYSRMGGNGELIHVAEK